MADIRIERKSNNWLWILIGLVILALIIWFFFLRTGNDRAQTSAVPAEPAAQAPPAAPTGTEAPPGTAAAAAARPATPQAVTAFLDYSSNTRAAQAADRTHAYTAGGLRALADALAAVSESGAGGAGASAHSGLPQLDSIRAQADAMQRDPQSLQHATQARQAFHAVAQAMGALQSRFPQSHGEVKAVQDAADGLDAGRPLLEQSAQVEQFFAKAAAALRAMTASQA
jgi:hypothetical protein